MGGQHETRTAVVTGAASGIGRATALLLASEGAHVVATDVDGDELGTTADLLTSSDASFEVVVGDIVEASTISDIVRAAGEVDLLANIAGVADFVVPAAELDDEIWERVMAINVTAPMKLSRAVLPGMVDRNMGSIVNVASVSGMLGGVSGTAYTVSKHALIGLTKSTAFFYGPSGVRCNALCPGGVKTNIAKHGGVPMVPWAAEHIKRATKGRGARLAMPEELAAQISFLLGPAATNINGAIIPSDNGWSAS